MANVYTRKDFLKTTTLAGFGLATASFPEHKPVLHLSFSTLGCPDWPFEKIVDFAVQNGYQGIELRGLLRQLDLTKCTAFNSKESILASRKLVESKNIKIVNLGASAELHHADADERKKNIDEAKSIIRLAEQLHCPYVRVFPNALPESQTKEETLKLIAAGLQELGDYAKTAGITVLLETHGDIVESADIKKIMELAAHANVGLVWDVMNMWAVTREPLVKVYDRLKAYIRHIHLKDISFAGDKLNYVPAGSGETPFFEAVDLLIKNRFKGYYSFEWEEFWHPNIVTPELAIAGYAKVMQQHFRLKVKGQ